MALVFTLGFVQAFYSFFIVGRRRFRCCDRLAARRRSDRRARHAAAGLGAARAWA
jgi:hypothetical protein